MWAKMASSKTTFRVAGVAMNMSTEAASILSELYAAYQNGNTGRSLQRRQLDEEGGVALLVTQSGGSDMMVAEHVIDDVYAVLRVEASHEGRSERNRRIATIPTSSPNRQFEYCGYQLKETTIPALRGGAGARALYEACNWRQNATPIRTANSEQELVRAWQNHYEECVEDVS